MGSARPCDGNRRTSWTIVACVLARRRFYAALEPTLAGDGGAEPRRGKSDDSRLSAAERQGDQVLELQLERNREQSVQMDMMRRDLEEHRAQFRSAHDGLAAKVMIIDEYQAAASAWAVQVAERLNKIEFGVDPELHGVWRKFGARHYEVTKRVGKCDLDVEERVTALETVLDEHELVQDIGLRDEDHKKDCSGEEEHVLRSDLDAVTSRLKALESIAMATAQQMHAHENKYFKDVDRFNERARQFQDGIDNLHVEVERLQSPTMFVASGARITVRPKWAEKMLNSPCVQFWGIAQPAFRTSQTVRLSRRSQKADRSRHRVPPTHDHPPNTKRNRKRETCVSDTFNVIDNIIFDGDRLLDNFSCRTAMRST